MPETTCHMSISMDGFVAGPDQSRENPLGRRGLELHDWHTLNSYSDRILLSPSRTIELRHSNSTFTCCVIGLLPIGLWSLFNARSFPRGTEPYPALVLPFQRFGKLPLMPLLLTII